VSGMRDHRPLRPSEPDADAAHERVTYTARLVPPVAEGPSMRTEIARRLAEAERNVADRPAGTRETISRRHAARVIARLGEIHSQAAAEPEPEAGA
jgi:hypothetical protein